MSSTGKERNRRRRWLSHGRPARWREEEASGRCGAGLAGQEEVVQRAAALALDAWGWRGGSESGGACTQCVGVERRFREGFLAAVGLAGKRNKGGELRRGVEGGRGANKEGNGVRRSQGGLAALQSTAQAAGGRGNRRRGGAARAPTRLEIGDGVEDLTVICKKFRGLTINKIFPLI